MLFVAQARFPCRYCRDVRNAANFHGNQSGLPMNTHGYFNKAASITYVANVKLLQLFTGVGGAGKWLLGEYILVAQPVAQLERVNTTSSAGKCCARPALLGHLLKLRIL
jgi:hypothetical protein